MHGPRNRVAAFVAVAAVSAMAAVTGATPAAALAQSVQYRSPAGVEYRSLPDTGPVARAQGALAADPRNVQRFNSVREFDRALDDLTHGSRIDSTVYGIWYHLGIVRYSRGEFAGAAEAFKRAQPRAPDAGELAGSTDWLWMSLSRAGHAADARAMLARRPDSLPIANAYTRRLKLYRGEISPDEVFTAADTADVQVATLSYGVGNWYLVRGDTTRARSWFERSVRSGGWPGFGFIMSEVELRRLR